MVKKLKKVEPERIRPKTYTESKRFLLPPARLKGLVTYIVSRNTERKGSSHLTENIVKGVYLLACRFTDRPRR